MIAVGPDHLVRSDEAIVVSSADRDRRDRRSPYADLFLLPDG